ncbi:Bax inhibitor-1/YccA family protein [Streptomyces sp. NPDC007205]|uniref:Bax inhibitor-1/YccA family protein n=1 Tax=Streptomyces sp. NPDC007205 TaxID=3154316 RepID=UPI0033FDEF48
MRSNNPVFRRGFPRSDSYTRFGTGGAAAATDPYGYGGSYGHGGGNPYTITSQQTDQASAAGHMTMDDVIARTTMTLGTVVIGSLLAWFVLPVTSTSYGIAIGAGLVAMLLGVAQSFKRTPSPILIIAYAAFEGVFLGVISRMYNEAWQGAPVQAMLGTAAVLSGLLLAYKTRVIRVTQRYLRIGTAVAIGFLLLTAVNLLFAPFGGGLVLSGGLGIFVGIIGVLLGAFFLSLDFKRIEDGIQYGAPRDESWLAAFGLTMSLVWIYLEMVRLITLLRRDD